jgi:hypothetical protein
VYAPFTMSGTILVNDVKSSNYIAFQSVDSLVVGEWKSALSYHWLAHMSQSPHRIWVRVAGVGDEIRNDVGISIWVDYPHMFGEWLLEQNPVVLMILLVPVLSTLLLASAIEMILSWTGSFR